MIPLYAFLWGLTATVGVAEQRRELQRAFSRAMLLKEFNPSEFKPLPPGSPERFYYVGRVWSPYPFRVDMDLVHYDEKEGVGNRVCLTWLVSNKLYHLYSFWQWKRSSS